VEPSVVRQDTSLSPLPSRKSKTKMKQGNKFFLYTILFFFVMMILTGSFAYGTKQGFELRRMLAGSILSSQHPQYAKFLLPDAELSKLKSLILNPPSVRSTISEIEKHFSSTQKSLVVVDTVETPNFTAKVMKVNDPTTIHLVSTKYKHKGQALSELIADNGAVAGINAGGFKDDNGNGSGGQIIGIALGDGKVLSEPGMSHNTPMLVGGFTKSGQFITGSYSINNLQEMGVTEAVSFGPQLVVDRKDVVSSSIDSAYGWAPRTAIGQTEDGTVVMIITDGRFYHDKRHRGASMEDLAKLFLQYNVVNAIALDGGGSTTMISNGELQLQPATSTRAGMRYLPNAFVVIPH
jgi:exopolysaccharide biosynthesis protein